MITTLLRPQAEVPPPDADFWYQPVAPRTASGVRVDSEKALRLNAYLACIRVRAELLAVLPWILYRERPDGGKDKAVDHPMFQKFNRQPNRWQTRFEFVEMMQAHCDMRGNAFAEIVPVGDGSADLVPFNPDRMKVEQLANGRLRYTYRNDDGIDESYSQEQIFHLRGLSTDGLVGFDPVNAQSDTIGTAMAVNLYRGRYFMNDATPGGVLIHPGKLSPEAKKNLETSFAQSSGHNQHRWRVFEEGMKPEVMAANAEESQLADVLKLDVEEIARMFRVPLHMIQLRGSEPRANFEQESLDFVVYTLGPIAERWELAAQRDIVDGDDLFTEFMFDRLLRGDSETRWKNHQVARMIGVKSPNDVRLEENMNPREDGDNYDNPNTTPGPQGEMPDDEPEDDEESAAWIGVMAADCVQRITHAETRTLAKHIKHAETGRDAFVEWSEKFYATHREFVVKTLSPFSVALGMSGTKLDVEGVAADHTQAECSAVSQESESTFYQWSEGLADRLMQRINGAIQ